jgi:hypothetical protein
MTIKIADLQARVLERVFEDANNSNDPYAADDIDPELVALVVRLTLAGVDLHVATDGEVYSPAPEARFMPPGMEAKWGGGSRPARGRRRR